MYRKREGPTLDDEEPSPTGHTAYTIQFKDTGGDQSGKSGGENVAGVEDRDSRRDFCSCVELRDDVDRSWIIGCLDYT